MTIPAADASRRLDFNAAAGPLAELFAVDLTLAVATCASCRSSAPLAAHLLYADAPALVVRCPSCAAVILRYATLGHRIHLDLTGSQLLTITLPATEPADA